jgi:hypothetical protein
MGAAGIHKREGDDHMIKKLEALQQMKATKEARPGRCSTTCVVHDYSSIIVIN